jgi:hypothetical protein
MDWHFKNGWFAMLRMNDIAAGKVRSTALIGGVGYRFGEGSERDFHWSDSWLAVDPPRSEVDIMFGHAVLNSFHSEAATAQALSLRTRLSRHFAASLTDTVARDVPLDWPSGTAVQR